MKKIILFGVGGLLFFIILVGLVFGILTLMESTEEKIVVPPNRFPTEEDHSILGLLLEEKQVVIDSLKSMIDSNQVVIDSMSANLDSLSTLAENQQKTLTADSTQITRLKDQINRLQGMANNEDNINENIKQLAKTYERMKVSEIKPIFAKLDDETVILLYNSMSSRKRPMVIEALSSERAAKITKKLAAK